MSCCSHYEIARSLVPYMRTLRERLEDWPEAYCDVTTAYVFFRVPGWFYQCGMVENRRHIWLKYGELNVDYTATQFHSLRNKAVVIDGLPVVYGTDLYLESLGYKILPLETCRAQMAEAGLEIDTGVHGRLNPQGWCRNFNNY